MTAEIREYAQQYTVEALEGLAQIARTSTSDAARVAAWNALLDRGHGRPVQGVNLGTFDGKLTIEVVRFGDTKADPRVIEHKVFPCYMKRHGKVWTKEAISG